VDADAEPHLLIGRSLRVLPGHGLLNCDGTLHRIYGAREIDDEAIARCVEDPTSMRGDQVVDDDSVSRESAKSADLISAHEGAVARDIGGENCGKLSFDGSGLQGSASSRARL
jgi:hypothetical protein